MVELVSELSPLGDEELYFHTEPFPGNTPYAMRGRGKHRLRDKPVAAGHTPWLLPPTRSGSQARPGPPGCRGAAAAAPAQLSQRTFDPVRKSLGNGVGAGPIAAPERYRGELVPHTSSRHPNSLGKGTPSLSCSVDGTVQMRKACKVEPEF